MRSATCSGVGDDDQAGAGQEVQAEVAAAFGLLVVLFGQDGVAVSPAVGQVAPPRFV
jgi:hypothetical protein